MRLTLSLEKLKQIFVLVLGIDSDSVSHRERWVSMLGGFIGIYSVILISWQFNHGWSAALIVASIGSSAVLVFAIPHGKLSQPWPVLGGHVIAAFIGVLCAKYIPYTGLAAGLAVGLSIVAMHYLRCIHPPGGATALAAVIGSQHVQNLGFTFVLTPVLENVLILIVIAVLFNLPFPMRRYPQGMQALFARRDLGGVLIDAQTILHDDINQAIEKMDIVVDITDDELVRLFQLANEAAQHRHLTPEQIRLRHYYSNGGPHWSIRQIIDESTDRDQLVYRVVAGHASRTTGRCAVTEFARWARLEVERDNDGNWRRRVSTTVPIPPRQSSAGR